MNVHSEINTLKYDEELCNNCGTCSTVCPHAVFKPGAKTARIVAHERCMECGACMINCPEGAIHVEAGVGCAAAMFAQALFGKKEATCCS